MILARITPVAASLFALLLGSCAYEGAIVQKEFRPLPFTDSLGVDGIYTFKLRDRDGYVHSQMVTADVFARYALGSYFKDGNWFSGSYLLPSPSDSFNSPALSRRPLETTTTPDRRE